MMFSGGGVAGEADAVISAGVLVAIATINAGKYCSQNDEK
jgi:hypothetical protein